MNHRYGWRRPLPGLSYPRADTSGLNIAPEVDPRPLMPPVFDQGQLGSCTANATNRCFQADSIHDGRDCGYLSRLWTYYFERSLEHTLDQGDAGAMGHDAFIVAKHGIPDESRYPYDISKFEAKPPNVEPRAYTLKKPVREVAQSVKAIKQVLSNKQTIAIGFTVYESFESEQAANTGMMPMPAPGEQILGGHEVLVEGYLAKFPHYALVANSWGEGWGDKGYFYMPWTFLVDRTYCSDFRTVKR